jgi:hypothetical protein
MGRIADALRANLRTVAQSDARSLRVLDEELKAASEAMAPGAFPAPEDVLALRGSGSFQQQSVATLRRLCRQHGITGFSRLKKAELAQVLEQHGVEPPPRPWESFSKKDLVTILRQLTGEG